MLVAYHQSEIYYDLALQHSELTSRFEQKVYETYNKIMTPFPLDRELMSKQYILEMATADHQEKETALTAKKQEIQKKHSEIEEKGVKID